MSISPQDAAAALQDIAATESRSRELQGYRIGAPILMIWGVTCFLGYVATGISVVYGPVWIALSFVAMVVTIILSRRGYQNAPAASVHGRRISWTWATMMMFYFATLAVMRPHELDQLSAFPALLVAATYMVMGIWAWKRYAILGIAIFALTLIGLYGLRWYGEIASPLPHGYFSFWMAAVMGLGLVLGGLWLRKV